MPLQIQLPYNGDKYLFQGISQAGQSMGGALQNVLEKYKQKKDMAKAADYFAKAHGGADKLGIPQDVWDTSSADDRIAAVTGAIQEQGFRERDARMQEQQARAQAIRQKVQEQQDEAEGLPMYAQEWERAGQAPPPQPNPQELGPLVPGLPPVPGPPPANPQGLGPMGLPPLPATLPATETPPWLQGDGRIAPPPLSREDRAMVALSRVSKLNPRLGAAMAKIILPQAMGAQEDMTMGNYTVPSTGATFAFRGKQFLPAGIDPGTAQPKPPIGHFDEDGKLTGYSEFDPKKGYVFKEAKNTGLRQATLPDGTPLNGWVQSADGKMHDVRTLPQKLGGGAAAQPTAANKDALIQQAKDAIAKGADAAMVKQRLKQNYGIDLK